MSEQTSTEHVKRRAGSVVALWRYPVKSMAGERLEVVAIDADGIVGDRRFAVRDIETGKIASAKRPARWGLLLRCIAGVSADGAVRVTLPDGHVHTAGDPALDRALSQLLGRRVHLEAVAAVDQAGEQLPRAVRLLGAADRFRRTKRLGRFPLEAERYEQLTARLGQELTGPEFQRCWDEGERLSLHEAVDYSRRGRGEQSGAGHGWPSITPVELQVTGLVAAGLTNPQIAEQLFVSRNTVKTHLSHIYTKLGIASRAALAAEAARRDQGDEVVD